MSANTKAPAAQITPNNYVNVQGWMRCLLGLQGSKLMVYAIVFGFSQDGVTEYEGSTRYICDWLGCSRPTATKYLRELTDEKLVLQIVREVDGVDRNFYRANPEHFPFAGAQGGGKNSLQGGGKNSLHKNISKEYTEKIKGAKPLPKREVVAAFMLSKIAAKTTNKSPRYWAWAEAEAFLDYYTLGEGRKANGQKLTHWKQAAAGWVNRAENRGDYLKPHPTSPEAATARANPPAAQYTPPPKNSPAPFARD